MATTELAAKGGFVLRRLSPALGAEVEGLDLSHPLPGAVFEALRAALQEHHVVCVRGQSLTEAQQIAFSELFGPLEAFPEKDKTKSQSTIYNVANVSPEGQHLPVDDHRVIAQKVNARWHTDSSYRFFPAYCSLLYGIEVLPPDAEVDAEGSDEARVVAMARKLGGRIITNDPNLAKIAARRSVPSLNVNDVAVALRPSYVPGDFLSVRLVKAGEEPGQGVGSARAHLVMVENFLPQPRGKLLLYDRPGWLTPQH